jgi:hypothetical protein
MAVKVSISPGGSIQSSSTWATTDTTSLSNGTASNTAVVGTTFITSVAFTPGAITIDGIGLRINSAADTVGTINVQLAASGTLVTGTLVTINKSDLTILGPGQTGYNWIFFKFASPVTLVTATAYTIQIKVSAGLSLTLICGTSNTDFLRFLRTTTTGAPASTDNLIILCERTGAATFNNVSVTMDNTATTQFCAQIDISDKGTLSWSNFGSSAYYLNVGGNLNIWVNGFLTIGTVVSPMPATTVATVAFNCTSANQFGLNAYDGSTITMYGATKTVSGFITSAVAASQPSVNIDVSTGLVVGDFVVVASTDTTPSHCELRQIGTISGTSLTMSANFTYAHLCSTGPPAYVAEWINLSRNIVITPVNTLYGCYWGNKQSTVLNLFYVEMAYFGSNGTNYDTTSSNTTVVIEYCSFHNWNGSINIGNNSYTNSGNVTFQYNVVYNMASHAVNIYANTTLGTTTLQHNVMMVCSGYLLNVTGCGCTLTSNYLIGGSSGGIGIANQYNFGTWNLTTMHSCGGPGFIFYNNFVMGSGIVSNTTAWCCTHGFRIANSSTNQNFIFVLDSGFFYSMTTGAIAIDVPTDGNILIRGFNVDAGIGTVSPWGFQYGGGCFGIDLDTMVFGQYHSHTVADIHINGTTTVPIVGNNVSLLSTVPVSPLSSLIDPGFIGFSVYNGNNFKAWFQYGSINTDSTIYHTPSQSSRITPISAAYKLCCGAFRVAVANGTVAIASIYIRRSVSGDGAAYNGNPPRLILAKNVPMGQNSNIVIATSSATAGTWELLQGTCPAPFDDGIYTFYVDCDGTTGWVNIDDFNINIQPISTMGFEIWQNGQPQIMYGAPPPKAVVLHQNKKVM